MSREDRIYAKPPLSVDEMIALFESRNLTVPDRGRARHYLTHINYYRLSGYGYLFEEDHTDGNRSHRFQDGASFEDILSLYVFDRHLRLLVMDAIERIEVGVRTVIAYELSHRHGTGHWYLNDDLFKETDDFSYSGLIRNIKQATAFTAEEGSDKFEQRQPFITHYYANYDEPEYPPSWMLIEVMSLGSWSRVYAHLKISRDRKCISRVFDLPPDILESWLHSLTYMRNMCAHHSQIYGRRLAFPPKSKDHWPELPRNAFARFIAVMEYLLRKMAPDTRWGAKVKSLIEGEPLVDPERLGIQNHDFWECDL